MARESTATRKAPRQEPPREIVIEAPTTRTLVTGFGSFPGTPHNPTGALAEQSGRSFEVLDVSYRFVRHFFDRLDPARFDRLLLLGVASGSTQCRIELFARNLIGATPDIHGEAPGPCEIASGSPKVLGGTLWDGTELLKTDFLSNHAHLVHSFSAGTYLCNFAYYEALLRFRDKKIGFLHVPLEEDMPFEVQAGVVQEVLDLIEAEFPQ